MTPPDINVAAIRNLQAALLQIKLGNIGFFNIAQLSSMGLVKIKNKFTGKLDSKGERMLKTQFSLTAKGNRILNVVV